MKATARPRGWAQTRAPFAGVTHPSNLLSFDATLIACPVQWLTARIESFVPKAACDGLTQWSCWGISSDSLMEHCRRGE